ncbi:ureidoglycolate lyase [Pseudorhodobacter antarcticus]|uniref:Ureidoglycolate lyase n=1 Tax=Pseudorhodobacter antarcticus TaxID=1077947 RepID=A0A1H8FC12_9RHOB|nr:ureidoglycolate lyase [Pseudorhodobacter antarcticus]SEN28747.1 ureidoglycolate lyase [Pseudorhodobacter antarcticus]
MTRIITPEPLTAHAFAPFGDVLDATGTPDKMINQGLCGRFHDRAQIDVGDARTGISIFHAQARSFPYTLDLVERHPDGSQAFLPMTQHPFLVIVTTAPDAPPRAFITNGAQGINLHRGTWHGVLTPLHAPGLFAVVDRIGPTPNLEEHIFALPWVVTAPGISPTAPATGGGRAP